MSIDDGRKYTKDHEWIKEEAGILIVGITDFAQSELGELVFVDLPKVGKEIKKGDVLCVVESTKAASDVYAPVSGKVVEVNDKLQAEPSLVNSSPLAEGWIAKIESSDKEDLKGLLAKTEYEALISGK